MDVTIPLVDLIAKTIESLEPRTLFLKHDDYRLGSLLSRDSDGNETTLVRVAPGSEFATNIRADWPR